MRFLMPILVATCLTVATDSMAQCGGYGGYYTGGGCGNYYGGYSGYGGCNSGYFYTTPQNYGGGSLYAPPAILAPKGTNSRVRTEGPTYLPSREIKARLRNWVDFDGEIKTFYAIKIRAKGRTIWAPLVNGMMPQVRKSGNYYRFAYNMEIPYTARHQAILKSGKPISYDRFDNKHKGETLVSYYKDKNAVGKLHVVSKETP